MGFLSLKRVGAFCAGVLFIALGLYAAGSWAGASSKDSGLACFSIVPPPPDGTKWPTCDALCAAKGAVCTGMQNGGVNPPTTCADPASPKTEVCRCCALER